MKNPFQAAGTVVGRTYIERDADTLLMKAIRDNKRFPYVLAPRQSGKSSLLQSTIDRTKSDHYSSVYIDLQAVGYGESLSYTGFLETITLTVAKSLLMEEQVLSSTSLETVLELAGHRRTGRIIIYLDEIDSLRGTVYKDTFLGLIRSFFNRRSRDQIFQNIQFVLAGAMRADDLISDPNRSPFNVGVGIPLTDLSRAQVEDLVSILPLDRNQTLFLSGELYNLTSGSVYLTQLLLERLWDGVVEATDSVTESAIKSTLGKAVKEIGGDIHFSTIRVSLEHPSMSNSYLALLAGKKLDLTARKDLEMTGLINSEGRWRNRLYRRLFGSNGKLRPHLIPMDWPVEGSRVDFDERGTDPNLGYLSERGPLIPIRLRADLAPRALPTTDTWIEVLALIDTGCTNTIIDFDTADRLGLVPTSVDLVQVVGSSKPKAVDVYQVMIHVAGSSIALSVFALPLGLSGIGCMIGLDILRLFEFSFDGQTKVARLRRHSSSELKSTSTA